MGTSDVETIIPTSGVKFTDQVKSIRAYVVIASRDNNPVHYKGVMQITRLGRTQISGLNSFFVMLGLLEPSKKGYYIPTEAALTLCQNLPGEEEFSSIRDVLEKSYLSRTVREYFLVHGRSDRDSLIAFLLDQAGSKEASRASTAIDWLESVGLVKMRDDGLMELTNM